MYTTTSFEKATDKIFRQISDTIPADSITTVRAIISGDVAFYHHIGSDLPHNLDVEFSVNIILPDNLVALYTDGDIERELVLSRVKIPLGLIHDDYARDAIFVSKHPRLDVYVLSAIDLAVSKLGRLNDKDKLDIKVMAEKGLYSATELKGRANEALRSYVGDTNRVKQNIKGAIRSMKEVKGT